MKRLINEIVFGKNAVLSGLIALAVIGSIALGCNCGKNSNISVTAPANSNSFSPPPVTRATSKADASKGEVPTNDQLQDIARTTVLDFNDAIQSGDFADFHETLSKPFQKQISAEKLEGVFNAFIEAKMNFREVKDLEARFTSTPSVAKSLGYKMLTLKGNYATTPRRTNFELKYIPEGSDWRLSSIDINTKDQ